MKFKTDLRTSVRKAGWLGLIATLLWAGAAQAANFNMAPYIDTSYALADSMLAANTGSSISNSVTVIGAEQLQVTIFPIATVSDSLWVTLEVSNDQVAWINASAKGDSTLIAPSTKVSLFFPYAAVYRYYRIRTSVPTTADNDQIDLLWRVGAGTNR